MLVISKTAGSIGNAPIKGNSVSLLACKGIPDLQAFHKKWKSLCHDVKVSELQHSMPAIAPLLWCNEDRELWILNNMPLWSSSHQLRACRHDFCVEILMLCYINFREWMNHTQARSPKWTASFNADDWSAKKNNSIIS